MYRIYKTTLVPVITFFLFSCSTVQNSTPSQIGLVPLEGYRYTPANLPADTIYKLYQREEIFNSQFAASGDAVKRPGFGGQWVVGILLPSTATTPLRFERAEMVGRTVNVYAQTCAGADCNNSPAILATIPRVGSAQTVRFFINGERRNEVEL